MRSLVLAVLAATMLVPAAAAATLDVRTSGLTVAGEVDVQGGLLSLRSTGDPEEGAGTPPASRVAPAEIRIQAEAMRIETDVETVTGSPFAGAPERGKEVLDLGAAQLVTQQARQGFLLFLAPGQEPPRFSATATSVTLTAVASGGQEPSRRVPTERAMLESAPGAGALLGPTSRSVRIEGDFTLMLWEWDMLASNATGQHLVRSGFTYQPTAPSVAGVPTAGRSEERQVFVHAQGAVLEVAIPVGAALAATVTPETVTGIRKATFHRPLEGLKDGDWVEGDLTATFTSTARDTMALRLEGVEASSAGQVVAAPAPWWPMWAAAAAVALLVAVRPVATRLAQRAVRKAADQGDHEAVVRLSNRRAWRGVTDASLGQRAVSLLLLGRPDEAARALGKWRKAPDATREYLWACIHAMRGETVEAARRVKACLQADPALGSQLLGDPMMRLVTNPQSRTDGYA